MFLGEKSGRGEFALKILCTTTQKQYIMVGEMQEVAEVLQQASEHQLPHGPLSGSAEQGSVFCGSQSRMGPQAADGVQMD